MIRAAALFTITALAIERPHRPDAGAPVEARCAADPSGALELRGDEPPRGHHRVPDGADREVTARAGADLRHDRRGPRDAARHPLESGREQAGRAPRGAAGRVPPRQHPRRRSRGQRGRAGPDAPAHERRPPAPPRPHGHRHRADLQHRRQRRHRRDEPDGPVRACRRRRPAREHQGPRPQPRLHEARIGRGTRARRGLHRLGSAPRRRPPYDQRVVPRLSPHAVDPAEPLAQPEDPRLPPRDDDAGDHEVARGHAQGARLLLRQLRPRQRRARRAAPMERLRLAPARGPELRRLPQPPDDPLRGLLVPLVQAPDRSHRTVRRRDPEVRRRPPRRRSSR